VNRPTPARVEPFESDPVDPRSGRTARRWLRVLVALILAALVAAYVVYMSLGMPGMDHAAVRCNFGQIETTVVV
jgi:hypothetical protein